jgi:nucleoside-diphosphate-sugar epimerase
MRILIFGASGFIGTHLARHMAAEGHDVIAFCRSGHLEGFSGKCVQWAFGASLKAETINGADCAIHLAHDFNAEQGARRTAEGTIANVRHLRDAGIKRQAFFSSYSAGKHATSLYGRTKFAIENNLGPDSGVVIVRPGLVLGDGGIYGRIRKWAVRLQIIPLPDGGQGKVPVIGIDRLCRETLRVIESKTFTPELNLFERQPRTLRQLVLDSAAEAGRKPLIVNIPSTLILYGLRIAAALRLPIPVNADNLEGFIANQAANHVSTIQE